MIVQCERCLTEFVADDELGGRWNRCDECEHRFMLPIPDEKRMLSWLKVAPWDEVQDFVKYAGARGHSESARNILVRIVERRRWKEEYRIRREELPKHLPSIRERAWKNVERREHAKNALDELRQIPPAEFEALIAKTFSSQGYNAFPVGGTKDNGIDVEIWKIEGGLWAVAQCKRYSSRTAVTSKDIRAFAGAFMLSQAEAGFYITSGRLTRPARSTASRYKWLTVFSSDRAVKFIRDQLGERVLKFKKL